METIKLKNGRIITLPPSVKTVGQVKEFLKSQNIDISSIENDSERSILSLLETFERLEKLSTKKKVRSIVDYSLILKKAINNRKDKEVFNILWKNVLQRIDKASLKVRYSYKMFKDLLDLLEYIANNSEKFTEEELTNLFSEDFHSILEYPISDYEEMYERTNKEIYRERSSWLRACLYSLDFELFKTKEEKINAIKHAINDLSESLLYW
jgi:hypothetical protein